MVMINLRVKTIDGADLMVAVDDQISLGCLRDQIETRTNISKEQQKLIFRGKVLTDETRSLSAYGFTDGLALHVVINVPSPSTFVLDGRQQQESSQSQQHQGGGSSERPELEAQQQQIFSQNVIVGHVPFERTAMFADPNDAVNSIEIVLTQIREIFRLDTATTLQLDRPNSGDFSINVNFRGIRNQTINSPARERFEALKMEMKKLTWLVILMKTHFVAQIEAILSGIPEPNQEAAHRTVGDMLLAMHSFDHFDENALRNTMESGNSDAELLTLLQELDDWQLLDDEAHLQNLNPHVTVRHCLSMDLSRLLVILQMVDAKINEHLLGCFNRLLIHRHNLQASSYSARMMNCFAAAVARVQHARAHIYHSLSDIGVHVDDNGMNRLYPQFVCYERDESPQAEINMVFYHPRNQRDQENRGNELMDTGESTNVRAPHNQSSNEAQGQSRQNSLNAMLLGVMQFAQQFLGVPGQHNLPISPTQSQSNQQNVSTYTSTSASGSTFNTNTSRSSGTSSSSARNTASTRSAEGVFRSPSQNQMIREQQLLANLLFGQIPRPSARGNLNEMSPAQRRVPRRQIPVTLGWSQTSPEAPNAMFVGPRPPAILPLFTIDPFLACSSRRYRVFESDSRHDDFWNDPLTIRLGIQPPPDSIARRSMGDRSQQENAPYIAPSNGNALNRMLRQSHSQDGREIVQGFRQTFDENSIANPQANENGEAVFNNMDDFANFVRQILESIVRCMAQYDSSIIPSSNSSQFRNGFTANSRVSGFAPYLASSAPLVPMPFPGGPFSGGEANGHPSLEGTITITAEIPIEAYRQQPRQPAPDNDRQ